MPGPRLIVVEDDADLSDMLRRLFAAEGYDVTVVRDGHSALRTVLSGGVDAVVLDRGLPDGDGLDVLARLRRVAHSVPVLVLTARGTVEDRVAGLDAGAEDYLVKPFEVEELLARVRALLRRHGDRAALLPLGDGWLDVEAGVARRPDGTDVPLSRTERDLLEVLARRPTRVFEREELRDRVFTAAEGLGSVDTYVYYLRRKLGRSVVRTRRGVGYRAGEIE